MMDPAIDPLEMILRQCAATAPEPWYPSAYAHANGIPRDNLDPYLDRLRMGGLIHLTDWVQGRGQGYALTPEGTQVLESPRHLAQLRAGKVERPRLRQPEPLHPTRQGTAWDRGEAVRESLLGTSTPLVTFALIFVNLVVFLLGLARVVQEKAPVGDYLAGIVLAQGNADVLEIQHRMGAIRGTDLVKSPWWQGDWWRLLSCCFVHFGLLHLGANMYTLYAVGPLLEQIWGRWRFLILYLVAGVVGSCALVFWNPLGTGAGASGALWGVIASLAAWILLNRNFIPPPLTAFWLRRLFYVFVLNVFISFMPGISAAAHFGGGAAGALAGAFLNEHRFGHGLQRWLAGLGVAALPVLCIVAVTKAPAIAALVGSPENVQRWEQLDWNDHYAPRVEALQNEAREIVQGKVEPLQRQRHEDRTVEAERAAFAALGEARSRLNDAINLLQQTGPYRAQPVEEKRQEVLTLLESQIRWLDRSELNDILSPMVEAADNVLEARAKPLLARDPRVRDPEDVKATIAAVNDEQAKLVDAAEFLKKAGPYKSEVVEEARQVASQRLEATAKLLELASRRLQRGIVWTRDEQRELDQQEQRVKELNERWKQLVH